MDIELIGLFRDLVRLETELWNRVEVTVQQAHGVPLACWRSCGWWLPPRGAVYWTSRRHRQLQSVGRARLWTKSRQPVSAGGTPNPTDGRSNLIQLTEPGVGLLAAADVTLSAALDTLVGAAAPADELRQMSSTLLRLRQHLSTPVAVEMAVRRS